MRAILLAAVLLLTPTASYPQGKPAPFITVDPSLPLIYIHFDHSGTALENGKPTRFFWLHIVNNSVNTLELSANGEPLDGLPGESDLRYEVMPEEVTRGVLIFSGPTPPPDPCEKPRRHLPSHNLIDVFSQVHLQPGSSLFFRVPARFFNPCWHIEIAFGFSRSPTPGPHVDDIGGQPVLVLRYGLYDLPPREQTKTNPGSKQ